MDHLFNLFIYCSCLDLSASKKFCQQLCKNIVVSFSVCMLPLRNLLRVTSGNEKKHIKYIVYEYEDLIDSSNMSTAKKLQIALDIQV